MFFLIDLYVFFQVHFPEHITSSSHTTCCPLGYHTFSPLCLSFHTLFLCGECPIWPGWTMITLAWLLLDIKDLCCLSWSWCLICNSYWLSIKGAINEQNKGAKHNYPKWFPEMWRVNEMIIRKHNWVLGKSTIVKALSHFMTVQRGHYHYHFHFTQKETETERGNSYKISS